MTVKFSTVYYPKSGGGYTVICPELHCASEGETYEQAYSNIIEAMELSVKDCEVPDLMEAYNLGQKIFTEVELDIN